MATLTVTGAHGLKPGGWVSVQGPNGLGSLQPRVKDNGALDTDSRVGVVTLHVPDEARRVVVIDNDGLQSPSDPRWFWEMPAGRQQGVLAPQMQVSFKGDPRSTWVLREFRGIHNATPWSRIVDGGPSDLSPRPGGLVRTWLPRGFKGLVTEITPTGRRRTMLVELPTTAPAPMRLSPLTRVTPRPVTQLNITSFYTDSARTIIDEAKYRAYVSATQPLFDMMGLVGMAADREATSPALKAAAIKYLLAWADAKALQWGATPTDNPQHMRVWTLSSLAHSHRALRDDMTAPQRAKVEGWLAAAMDKAYAHFVTARNGLATKRPQNLLQWFGAASAAVAAAMQPAASNQPARDLQAKFSQAAKTILQRSIEAIDSRGFLPVELGRRARALGYSTFSMTALTAMAAVMPLPRKPGDFDPWSHNDDALIRAARITLAGVKSPATFYKRVGVAQIQVDLGEQAWVHRVPARFGLDTKDIARYHRYLGAAISAAQAQA